MDKIAANNHIVALRKEIKKAKAMVAGNLIRKINKLKADKEKVEKDEEQKKKIDDKIERIYAETQLLKTIDPYPICKQATLVSGTKYWDNLLGDSKSTAEQRLSSRIACKNNVQKLVSKFRNDFKECDEWLTEYFEYREKKKDLDIAAGRNQKKKKTKVDKSGKKNEIAKANHERAASRPKAPPAKRTPKSKTSDKEDETLHPSWASKRKEKELLKAALSGGVQSKRVILNKS